MGYCIIRRNAVDSADDSTGAEPRHRHAGTRWPRAGHRPEPARQAQRVQPGDARRPVPRLRAAGVRRLPARGCPFRARRPLHGGPRPGRRRTEHRQRRAAVSRRRARSVATGRDVDQARRRRRARLVHDAWHRVAARRRHPGRGRRHPVLRRWRCVAGSIRSAAPPSGCRSRPGGAMRCGGCSPATSSTPTRRMRIGLVQEVAADAAEAQATAREIAHTIADRAAPLGVRAVLASAHLARTDGDDAAIERLRPEMTQTVRHRRRRRGRAVVHRAARSPVPGLARTGYARPSRCGRAGHGPLQEQCARSRVQPFRGARAREGVGNRRVRRPRRRVRSPDARRGVEAGRGTARRVVRRRRPPPADVRPRDARGDDSRVVQEVIAGLAAGRVVPRRPRRGHRRRARARDGGVGDQRVRRSAPSPPRSCIWRARSWRTSSTSIGNEEQRQLGIACDGTQLGRDHGADRARRRLGCRRGPHEGGPAGRRHLAYRRRQAVHHQRRHRRSVREHPAPGARPARGRRTGHQGPEPVRRAEVPARSSRPENRASATASSSPGSSTRWA